MNITFLIGNGFDINIGMKTRYSDFYKYYIKQPSENKIIDDLKKDLSEEKKIEYWSDLELALGDYTKDLHSISDFETIFDDITLKLSDYLINEEAKYLFENPQTDILYKDLVYPEHYLSESDYNDINSFKRGIGFKNQINIITFNYTTSLEKLLLFEGNDSKQISPDSELYPINHIHGFTDKEMILGVNDTTQISNNGFIQDKHFSPIIIKPECNKKLKRPVNVLAQNILSSSNLICLFGLSIGETDRIWWEHIGQLLYEDNCRLIIFSRGDEIPVRLERKRIKKEDEIKDHFFSKAKIPAEDEWKIGDKIYVGYNTNIFNIKLKPITDKE